jgi:coenzyme F420-reducing hydrogenase delta subunit/ferredoxin
VRTRAFALWQAAEARLDAAFGPASNPLRHAGSLAFFLFWVVAATGIYLYVFFDTSASGAWSSVEAVSRGQGPPGALVRGLHRYGSDAMVLALLAHVLREYLARHEGGFRWFSWVSGVPLVVLLYASGIGGFWLAWDELALFSATASAEWLDWLGVMPEPFVRNFLAAEQVSDRLFTLFIFLHIGVPLALLLGMWVHVQRLSRPRTQPAPALAAGMLAALAALALLVPVQSHAPADLARPAATLALDWLYLFPHPLMYATSPAALWAMLAGAVFLLAALPWLSRGAPLPAAAVSPQDCNGCGRCFADCPYSAVLLVPHALKARAPRMARVEPALCAGCGICAGACPSSTPFRATEAFRSGIDMPGRRVADLRARLERELATASGAPRVVVFGCDRGADVARVRAPDTIALSLICAGMLPPSFVEYALRCGADGVLVTGCPEDGCDFRFGQRWLHERFAGRREPHLRASVARERLRVAWPQTGSEDGLVRELAAFRARLAALGPRAATPVPPKRATAAGRG